MAAFLHRASTIDERSGWLAALDTAETVSQYPSIAIDADGRSIISYHGATNLDVKFASCTTRIRTRRRSARSIRLMMRGSSD